MIIRDIKPPLSTTKSKSKTTLILGETKQKLISAKRIREIGFIITGACIILFIVTALHLEKSGLRLKQNITSAASAGFEKIVGGALALDDALFENAKKAFQEAQETFMKIENEAWFSNSQIPSLTVRDPLFDSVDALVTAGYHLSKAGIYFTEVGEKLLILPKQFLNKHGVTEELKKYLPSLEAIIESLSKANVAMQKIPMAFIPSHLRERFQFAKNSLGKFVTWNTALKNDFPAILKILGDEEPHHLLILFQNNSELRPSGGFIGNLGLLQTNDGIFIKNDIVDVYPFDHELKEIIAPPAEILPANKRWFLRDANYSGHFPLSAAKAAWFLEKEGGPGVDTVIAIDQSFIAELIRLTGPIKIPELKEPLTSENFETVISYFIEAKLSGRENPKAILKTLMTAMQKSLMENVDLFAFLRVLQASIESKHLLGFSFDPAIQGFFERHGLAGIMKNIDPKEDYFSLVHTSIGGNKSDRYISESIAHDTFLKLDGSVIDEVTITRTHQWNQKVEKKLRAQLAHFDFFDIPEKLLKILGRSPNLHILRLYVPQGTILEKSSDPMISQHIDSEIQKTYFSATMNVPVGSSQTLKIRYQLPFKLNLKVVDKYFLTIQKQAGQKNITLKKRIFPDSGVINYKYFPETGTFDSDRVFHFETEFTKDMSLVSIWGK